MADETIVERLTKLETKIDNLTNTVVNFIEKYEKSNLETRIALLEQAEANRKKAMYIVYGALSSLVVAEILHFIH
mgnify:CR=1 FL=1